MPMEGNLKPCGPADAEGEIRERIQTNGRCESANDRGDTYGPCRTIAYVPGYLALRLDRKVGRPSGRALHVDRVRPALHRRPRTRRLALRRPEARGDVPFAWAAYPFTQYASSSNTNDSILPAFSSGGSGSSRPRRFEEASLALAGWTKFAALVVAPLWATYPDGGAPRRVVRYVVGYLVGSALAFSVLLLEPNVATRHVLLGPNARLAARAGVAVLDLGLGSVPREGIPDLHLAASCRQGAARRGRARVASSRAGSHRCSSQR